MSSSSPSGKFLTTLLCICQTEVVVNIVKFLESCVVHEGEDVHFECMVSHAEAPLAQWKLQDVPLQNNEMNLIKTEGRVHSLTLRGVTKADSGTVTFSVGNHTSTASLTVRGKTSCSEFWGTRSNRDLFPLDLCHLSISSFLWDTFSLSFQQVLNKPNMLVCLYFLRLFISTLPTCSQFFPLQYQ